jgi:hypothetical protein
MRRLSESQIRVLKELEDGFDTILAHMFIKFRYKRGTLEGIWLPIKLLVYKILSVGVNRYIPSCFRSFCYLEV